MLKEALLYEQLPAHRVHCFLCSHHCRIADGAFGFCGARENRQGTLFTHTYAAVVAACADPIEKKPFFHFLPGTTSFSIATAGCNFRCGFCQNWEISQRTYGRQDGPEAGYLAAEQVVRRALTDGCQSIAYTYTEPTIFLEYALEVATLAKEKGLANVLVTNGYMTKEALNVMRPYMDAANVDLKFFTEEAYSRICAGKLAPVLETIQLMREYGMWVEVTTLLIPGENDTDAQLSGIAAFLASVGKDIPWHVSRFHPDYRFGSYPPTPEATLKKAQGIGLQQGLRYVYVGNVSGWGSDTVCPSCGKVVIERQVFTLVRNALQAGACGFCKNPIAGVF